MMFENFFVSFIGLIVDLVNDNQKFIMQFSMNKREREWGRGGGVERVSLMIIYQTDFRCWIPSFMLFSYLLGLRYLELTKEES